MTFETDDRVFETSITTGTGTYTLDGAQVGFTTFSGMGANNLCPYFATDDTNWEVGIGTILTGPARLERTTILRSSNADAAVNWAAGTRKIRCGWPAALALPRSLSKSVAGSADVTLTTDEQRRKIIILTGALTGNINVIVDATPWDWIVYNNTTGAYTLTFKTTAGSGIAITQGTRTHLECDGTNVVSAITGIVGNAVFSGVNTQPNQPAFSVKPTATIVDPTGDGTNYTIVFDTEIFDQGGNFSSTTFTAPIAGRYQFNVKLHVGSLAAGHNTHTISLVTSNRNYTTQNVFNAGANPLVTEAPFMLSVLADMDAGDTAQVDIAIAGGAKVCDIDHSMTYFTGFLAC